MPTKIHGHTYILDTNITKWVSLEDVLQHISKMVHITKYSIVAHHIMARTDAWSPRNYRTNWQSTNQVKPWYYFSGLRTTFYFSESVQLTDIQAKLQNSMADFCSCDFAVREVLAFLQQCFEFILSIELKQSYCEMFDSVPAVFAKLSWNFHLSLSCCSPLAGPTIYHRFVDILSRYALFWWLVPENIAFCLQCSWTKFYLGQTEHCSARGDGPLCTPHHALIQGD